MLNRIVETAAKSKLQQLAGAQAPSNLNAFPARLNRLRKEPQKKETHPSVAKAALNLRPLRHGWKPCPFKAASFSATSRVVSIQGEESLPHPFKPCRDTRAAALGVLPEAVRLRPDTNLPFRPTRRAPSALLLLLPLLVVGGCGRKHFPHYPSDFREYAWVTNGGGNSVTVFDLVHMQTAATIAVGDDPVDVAVNPVRDEVYVVNRGSGTVSVIDAVRNRVTATIGVHREPASISVDAKGERAYVANAGSNNVSALDLVRRREVGAVGVGESPGLVRVSPDGATLVVTNRASGSVSIVDAEKLKVRAVFSGCPGASDAVILPDSSEAFAACSGGHQVMALGLARRESQNAAGQNPMDRVDRLLALLDVGPAPAHLALKPDGGEIFVTNFGGDTISEIATYANEVGGAYVIGANPSGGVVTADNSTLWVSNSGDNTVAAYSIDDGQRINGSTVQVGDGPGPLALTSNGFLLLAVDERSGDVSVLRTISYTPKGEPITGSLFTVLSAGKQPNAIAVKSFVVK
jgi:YVTN family beta-propeller protein